MNKKNYQAKIKSDLKISFYNDFIEWDVFYFDEIFSFIQTNNFTRSSMNNIKGNVKNIHYGDIIVKYNTILEELSVLPYINDGIDITKYKKNAYVKNGDIIIADTAEDYTAGKAIELKNVTSKVLSGLHTFLCRPKIKIAPMYLGYYLNSNQYHNQLIKLLTGVKVYSISKTNIVKTLIALPKSYEEQEKIAECLKSIDDLILQEEDKLEKLKSHKMGLLRKLLPEQDKNFPVLRFPKFKNSKGWINKKLGTLCEIETGKLDANAMVQNGKYHFYTCAKEYYLIDKYAYDTEALLISGNGAHVGYIHYHKGKFNAYQRTYILKNFNKNIFYIKVFLEKNLKQRINTEKNEGNTPYIRLNTLSDMEIIYPVQNEEQKKIAECLSSIDDLISAQTEKIETLTQHKKGLLQGLFPSIKEVENE